jgi:hypothetical protein
MLDTVPTPVQSLPAGTMLPAEMMHIPGSSQEKAHITVTDVYPRKVKTYAPHGMKPGEVEEIYVRVRLDSQRESDGTMTKVDYRLKDVTSISDDDDPTSFSSTLTRARAASILKQVAMMKGGVGHSMPDGHMPLSQWGEMTSVYIANLNARNIYSVQQLRDADDHAMASLPPGVNGERLREEARRYLITRQEHEAVAKLAAAEVTIGDMGDRISKLEAMVLKLAEGRVPQQPQSQPAQHSQLSKPGDGRR